MRIERVHPFHVLIDERRVDELGQRAVRTGKGDRTGRDDVDRRGDARIHGRHDLGTVTPVDLHTVVGRRVVARRHLDAGGDVEVLRGERHQRGRRRVGETHRRDARRSEDRGHVFHELLRPVTGIAADDYAPRRRVGHRCQ